jgi:hypothetical protein
MLHISGGTIVRLPGETPALGEKENIPPSSSNGTSVAQALGRQQRSASGGAERDNLAWGPRKKAYVSEHIFRAIGRHAAMPKLSGEVTHTPTHRCQTDPLIGHGRHFGRAVHTFCRPFPLIRDGLLRQIRFQANVLTEEDLSDQ